MSAVNLFVSESSLWKKNNDSPDLLMWKVELTSLNDDSSLTDRMMFWLKTCLPLFQESPFLVKIDEDKDVWLSCQRFCAALSGDALTAPSAHPVSMPMNGNPFLRHDQEKKRLVTTSIFPCSAIFCDLNHDCNSFFFFFISLNKIKGISKTTNGGVANECDLPWSKIEACATKPQTTQVMFLFV